MTPEEFYFRIRYLEFSRVLEYSAQLKLVFGWKVKHEKWRVPSETEIQNIQKQTEFYNYIKASTFHFFSFFEITLRDGTLTYYPLSSHSGERSFKNSVTKSFTFCPLNILCREGSEKFWTFYKPKVEIQENFRTKIGKGQIERETIFFALYL